MKLFIVSFVLLGMTANAQDIVVIPFVANGAGWDTSVVIANTGSGPATYEVSYVSPGSIMTMSVKVDALAVKAFPVGLTAGNPNHVTGFVEIRVKEGTAPSAWGQITEGNKVTWVAGEIPALAKVLYLRAKDMVITNHGDRQLLTVEYYDAGGQLLESNPLKVDALSQSRVSAPANAAMARVTATSWVVSVNTLLAGE